MPWLRRYWYVVLWTEDVSIDVFGKVSRPQPHSLGSTPPSTYATPVEVQNYHSIALDSILVELWVPPTANNDH